MPALALTMLIPPKKYTDNSDNRYDLDEVLEKCLSLWLKI